MRHALKVEPKGRVLIGVAPGSCKFRAGAPLKNLSTAELGPASNQIYHRCSPVGGEAGKFEFECWLRETTSNGTGLELIAYRGHL